MLVGQSVITGGIKDKHRGTAYHSRDIAIVGGIDIFVYAPDTALAEIHRRPGLDHTIDISAFLLEVAGRFTS
jgi:hypothetical protein